MERVLDLFPNCERFNDKPQKRTALMLCLKKGMLLFQGGDEAYSLPRVEVVSGSDNEIRSFVVDVFGGNATSRCNIIPMHTFHNDKGDFVEVTEVVVVECEGVMPHGYYWLNREDVGKRLQIDAEGDLRIDVAALALGFSLTLGPISVEPKCRPEDRLHEDSYLFEHENGEEGTIICVRKTRIERYPILKPYLTQFTNSLAGFRS